MVKKILFGMHFWLPALYTVVFTVISLIAGVAGGNWPYYCLGLSLSLLGSVILTYITGTRGGNNASAERAAEAQSAEERTPVKPYGSPAPSVGDEGDEDEALRVYDEQLRYTKDMTATPSQANGEYYNNDDELMKGGAMKEYYAADERRYGGKGYVNPAPRAEVENKSFSPYVQPANSRSASGARLSDFDDAAASGREQPRIFRLKSEPNVLLYEYKDFFKKYYVNPDGTRTLLSKEFKKK